MTIPAAVRDAVDVYLRSVDAVIPGLVEGFYVIGSAALGDFRPGTSDIDFVAVTAMPPADSQVAALGRVHGRLSRRLLLDGIYTTWLDLARDPGQASPGSHAHGRRLHPRCDHQRHPVTWHSLARHGAAVRGPEPAEIDIATDPAGLAHWARGNLDGYWRQWWQRSARLPTPAGLACLTSQGPAWCVLGVSRLHHTLITGKIISKTAAGEHARATFEPRWHRILDECLRIRRGDHQRSLYRDPFSRRAEALAFTDMVIRDAL
ncbi:aminoglycoside adenylyltransferase domain-containing protein [Frankia canadensis]|nr:aminoglycoside adenylyltransferase domain-containing protein [Frankia canadensis]